MATRNSLITVVATLLLLNGAVAHAQTNWRTFGFDLQRTGYNPEETILSPQTVPSLTLQWSIDLGAPMSAQPVEMNGILYAATWAGGIYAIDPGSGTVLWSRQFGTFPTNCDDFGAEGDEVGILGTPATDWGNGRIYLVSGDGMLHALDAVTGVEWPGYPLQLQDQNNLPPRTFSYASPTYVYEYFSLYVTFASACDIPPYHGQIVQVDVSWADTPTVVNRWFTNGRNGPDGGGIWGPGGVSWDDDASAIYTATGNALTYPEDYGYSDQVVRFDPALNVQAANGPPILSGDLDFGSTPVLYQPPNCPPQLAVMNKNGALYMYNRDAIGSGTMQVIPISSAGDFIGGPAYDPVLNQLYVGNNEVGSALIALAPQSDCTLAVVWQQQAGDTAYGVTPLITANGVVYYAPSLGMQVFAFDGASGQQLWNSGSLIGGYIFAPPMVVNGQLFVASFDHKLYAFAPP